MEAVIDSVTLNHLLREPKCVKDKIQKRMRFGTCLDIYMASNKLIFMVDQNRSLIHEWERTCGPEMVAVIINKWEAIGGIMIVKKISKLRPHTSKKLRSFGFNGTIDKLILKIALSRNNSIIVSDDNDFWDPKRTDQCGKINAPIPLFCKNELNIVIMLLSMLIKALKN